MAALFSRARRRTPDGMPTALATLAAASLALAAAAPAAVGAPSFTKLPGEMTEARSAAAAALLPDGNVLVAGGYNGSTYLKTAELFSPATGKFEPLSAELNVNRDETGTVVLPDGKVLLIGGFNNDEKKPASLKTAELFDPTAGKFELLKEEMTAERDAPAVALLHDGKVFITEGVDSSTNYLKTSELYDPATGKFTALPGESLAERYFPMAATLPDGKVLIAGGYTLKGNTYPRFAELFDPETDKFEKLEGTVHELVEPREGVGVATLADGRVLLMGGYNPLYLSTVEAFGPETSVFERLPDELTEARWAAGTVLLPEGRVLLMGGSTSGFKTLRTAEERGVLAPIVVTSAPSGVAATASTLGGTVIAETASTAYFQYGTTSSYGASTAPQTAGASVHAVPVSAAVAGLAPGSTYHYRLVAQNAGGTTYGGDQTFATAAAPAGSPSASVRPAITAAASPMRAGERGTRSPA